MMSSKWMTWLVWAGFLSVLALSCDDSMPVSPDTELYDLEMELVWTDAVNMDLWIIEPTGKGSGHGDPGITAINTGNNDCGFGDACALATCYDLPCNTPERIVINHGDALPDTTEPFHDYQIGISNWGTTTTTMTLTIRTPSQTHTLRCTVDAPRVSYVATVIFPSGVIVPVDSFEQAYCF